MARTPTPHLDRARRALVAQDHATARDALIEAWRIRRSPATATLVDHVAALAPDALSAQLAAVITPRVVTSHERLKAVAQVDDPRVSRFAIDCLLRLPFTARTAHAFLDDLIAIVERCDDTRVLPHVDAIAAGIDTRINLLSIRRALVAHLRRVSAAMTSVAAAPIEDELARLVEPLRKSTRSADALLADIYANPDDDAPRLVLADLLLEQGDPRGELISLQLERGDGEPTEREQELLKKHGKKWLGNLVPVLSWGFGYSHTKFRRGFVAVADIILSVGKKLAPIASDPSWATVEELKGSWPSELLVQAPLPALREIERGISREIVKLLTDHRRQLPGVRRAYFGDVWDIDPHDLRAALPNLERILVSHRAPQSRHPALFEPFGIDCVEVTHNWVEGNLGAARAAFDAYVDSLVGTTAPVARLILEVPRLMQHRARNETVELRRDAHGCFERV